MRKIKTQGFKIVPAYFISVCHLYFHSVYDVFQGQAFLIFIVSNLSAFP